MARTTTPLAVGLTSALAFGAFLAAAASARATPMSLMAPGRSGAGGDVIVADFAPEEIPDRFSYDGQTVYLAARALPDIDDAVALGAGPGLPPPSGAASAPGLARRYRELGR